VDGVLGRLPLATSTSLSAKAKSHCRTSVAARQEEAIIIRGSRYELTFQVNPPDDYLMSKKEGYLLTEGERTRVKEKTKQRATFRGRSRGPAILSPGLGIVELGFEPTLDKAGTAAVAEVEESRLVEYVNRCLANIDLARQRMSNDQIEIDRLREETRSLISDLMIA
jgi:hypothetical protein